MLDSHDAPGHLGAAQVVHCQVGAALVLVGHEGEAARLARGLVAHEVEVDDLAILREDREHVALGEREVEAADEDVGRVLELCVPGCRL